MHIWYDRAAVEQPVSPIQLVEGGSIRVTVCMSVMLANRHPMVLCGLKSVLHAASDFNVVASCQDGATCIEAIRRLSPTLVLLEISLPGLSGLEILAAIESEQLHTRAICYLAISDDSGVMQTIVQGTYGLIPKEASPQFLLSCLREAASGQRLERDPLPSPEQSNRQNPGESAIEDPRRVPTEHERQVARLVGEGLSNKEAERQLNLSESAIKLQLQDICRKLAIRNRTTLAALAADVELMLNETIPPADLASLIAADS